METRLLGMMMMMRMHQLMNRVHEELSHLSEKFDFEVSKNEGGQSIEFLEEQDENWAR